MALIWGFQKIWMFNLLVRMIPYFFYVPLNSLKSENDQIWVRFPALYEQTASLLFVAAPFCFASTGFFAVMARCKRDSCVQWLFLICLICQGLIFLLLWLMILFALYTDFRSVLSFQFDFDLVFSFSVPMEILPVLTWVALAIDLATSLAERWELSHAHAHSATERRSLSRSNVHAVHAAAGAHNAQV